MLGGGPLGYLPLGVDVPAGGGTVYTLTASVGSYTLTGQASNGIRFPHQRLTKIGVDVLYGGATPSQRLTKIGVDVLFRLPKGVISADAGASASFLTDIP